VGSFLGRELYVQYIHYCMHQCAHQIVRTDAYKTYHTAGTPVALRMKPGRSKHVEDIRNYTLIYKYVHFVGVCCVPLSLYVTMKKQRGRRGASWIGVGDLR
jgi:hypothetical protein